MRNWVVRRLEKDNNSGSTTAAKILALFRVVPVELACGAAGPRIAHSVDIVRRYKQGLKCLRAGYLTSTYFHYNGKHYKQLHGTAMGSPVSVVVAEIFMQNIEEQALATYS